MNHMLKTGLAYLAISAGSLFGSYELIPPYIGLGELTEARARQEQINDSLPRLEDAIKNQAIYLSTTDFPIFRRGHRIEREGTEDILEKHSQNYLRLKEDSVDLALHIDSLTAQELPESMRLPAALGLGLFGLVTGLIGAAYSTAGLFGKNLEEEL